MLHSEGEARDGNSAKVTYLLKRIGQKIEEQAGTDKPFKCVPYCIVLAQHIAALHSAVYGACGTTHAIH